LACVVFAESVLYIRTTTIRKKNLKAGTRYEFRVRARACGKEGAFSQSIAVRTESGVPSPPHIDNILEVKRDSVRILWSCNDCNGAAIRQYELQWRHIGSIGWQTASSTLKGTDCRKKNLLSNRRYEFRVRAMNRVGWGGWSGAVGCSTKLADEIEKENNVEEKENTNTEKKMSKEKTSEDKLAEWIKMKKKEQLAKEKVEEKRKRMERLEKEENEENRQQSERAKETKDKNHHYDHPNVSTPLGKKCNTVLPTEYYEMTDNNNNTYYWNCITGSDWNPPKWVDRYDDNHNIYYENTITGDSVWECPDDFIHIIRNEDGTPFNDGNIEENFFDENENDYIVESPLDDVLFSPGEKKMMESIYVETSSSNASPFAKQAMKNSLKKQMKKSSLRHSFKPPSSTRSVS
jgi:flagellar biosynthesis GTPase FlhF